MNGVTQWSEPAHVPGKRSVVVQLSGLYRPCGPHTTVNVGDHIVFARLDDKDAPNGVGQVVSIDSDPAWELNTTATFKVRLVRQSDIDSDCPTFVRADQVLSRITNEIDAEHWGFTLSGTNGGAARPEETKLSDTDYIYRGGSGRSFDMQKTAEGTPWCAACQSYHAKPETVEHWRKLQCRSVPPAPSKLAEAGLAESARRVADRVADAVLS